LLRFIKLFAPDVRHPQLFGPVHNGGMAWCSQADPEVQVERHKNFAHGPEANPYLRGHNYGYLNYRQRTGVPHGRFTISDFQLIIIF
jgi:hypothetical protein